MNAFIIRMLCIMLLPMTLCVAQEKPISRNTLENLLDAPKFHEIQIAESSFTETRISLGLIIREDIMSKQDVRDFLWIASQTRFLCSTDRDGKKRMPQESGSLRSVLQNLANVWDVLILIEGNTVYIVDPGDEDRFKHNVKIQKEEAKL